MKRGIAHLTIISIAVLLIIGGMYSGSTAYAQSSPPMAQWVDALPFPPIAQKTSSGDVAKSADYYEINMIAGQHQFNSSLGMATVWTYAQDGQAPSPIGPTIISKVNRPVVVQYDNRLPTDPEDFPLLNAIDPTIPGAMVPTGAAIPHLHGGHSAARFDGTPNQWWTADGVKGEDFVTDRFIYMNDQRPTLLWYHDHTMGATRLKPYLGLVGLYLLQDSTDNGQTILRQRVPSGKYHLPLIIQDKTFYDDGNMFYPDEGITDIHPVWVPEFFGDTPVVNGKAYPYLDAEPRRYRLRILNASSARFYNFHFKLGDSDLPFYVIGSDGGLLPKPVKKTTLLVGPTERFDVIIDFTKVPMGSTIMLTNDAPAPFPSGGDIVLPQIMKININKAVPSKDRDRSVLPSKLRLKQIPRLKASKRIPARDVVLHEVVDSNDNPLEVLINGLHFEDPTTDFVKAYSTEIRQLINTTDDAHPMHEHLVQFQVLNRQRFDVIRYRVDWQAYLDSGMDESLKPNLDEYLIGSPIPPEPEEMSFKDTVKAIPSLDPNDKSYSFVTRTIAKYAPPVTSSLDYNWQTGNYGKWVFHCHILEHEDNDMMRPFEVVK